MKDSPEKFRKKLKRYNLPNQARELTFSCYRRYPYFSDPIACWMLLDSLSKARIQYGFELCAYVIMPDHIHLLIYPNESGHIVPKVLHFVKGTTGRQYKDPILSNMTEKFDAFCIERRCIRKFQFWQAGGGYDRNLWNAKSIHSSIEYIEWNPVRAELVTQSDEWRWSSAWARKNNSGLVPDSLNIPVFMM